MGKTKFYVIFWILLSFMGCAAGMSYIKPGEASAEKGIIVFRVNCNRENGQECKPQVWITPENQWPGMALYKNKDTGLYVTQVDPGRYIWRRVQYYEGGETMADYKLPPFEVQANEIVYIGDVQINVSKIGAKQVFIIPSSTLKGYHTVKDNGSEVEPIIRKYLGQTSHKFVTHLINFNELSKS